MQKKRAVAVDLRAFTWLFKASVILVCATVDLHGQQGNTDARKVAAQNTRLLDRQAFDRVTLNVASGGSVIDTLLLDLPNRRVPDPLPREGSLQLRRLSEPSVLYKVPWSSVSKVEFFEDLLLNEAIKHAKSKELDESFEYLTFLYKNYPQLPGLKNASAAYLRQDALESYGAKNYEETLTVLLSLYDLAPQYRGLKSMVETVTNRMIEKHLADRDFAAARNVLDVLKDGFSNLKASNVSTWQEKFELGAKRQLSIAQKALEAKRYADAREATRRALAILPDATGAQAILDEISRLAPQIIVGVDELVITVNDGLEWSNARVAELVDPKLVTLSGFGAEGGKYVSRWANLTADDTGLLFQIGLNSAAQSVGISSETVAMQLLQRADTTRLDYRADFAGLFHSVEIDGGDQVKLHWRRSHVRPEALLDLSLDTLASSSDRLPVFQMSLDAQATDQITLRPTGSTATTGSTETIIEKYYDNDELAIVDLVTGDVDVLARIPPWQVSRLEQTRGVIVAPYRLPTVHALIPNYEKPIMARREFRRAICYGIDRPQILDGILLGGERRAGYRVLSAPIPAGVTITDPVGYAYKQGRQPRTYEPRLAAVLASVARNSLAKLAAAKAKQAIADRGESPEGSAPDDSESATADSDEKPSKPVEPLVLAHPPSPTATTACQTIKLQLGAIGIPVKLTSIRPEDELSSLDYDLRYAELVLWEPIVDVRRLLGPGGVAGSCSSAMSLALKDVDQARNWKEVRNRLRDVHEIAFNDLPVIPLWQTIDFYAHRATLTGIGTTPVTLYQNVANWKRKSRGGNR